MSLPHEPGARAGDPGDGAHGHVGLSWRRTTLAGLVGEPADLLVIGGGITGAGIARDAAMRGLRTILVEQHDLASGTSSRSSRLIHGGLRYLEHRRFRLVWEANRERRILLSIAPHLVRPLAFVFPIHEGDRLSLRRLAAGLWTYDLLALFRNVARHRMLGKRALLEREPMVRERGLLGGARYFDAQCDDARLVLATARSAILHGARVATYTAVRRLDLAGGQVAGALLEDLLTGEQATARATIVVNATGPWCDRIRRMEDPTAPPLLRPTKGAHVVVPRERLGNREAITFLSPIDGRVLFVAPWGPLSYVGTTDTDTVESPEEVAPSEDDVVYLLRSVNAKFPSARLSLEHVRAAWAGLRPLLAGDPAPNPSAVSREHLIVEGPAGLLSVAGGKLTTYRLMARQTVDRVVARLRDRGDPRAFPPARTAEERLPGGETPELDPFRDRALEAGLPAETADHLVQSYGTESAGIVNLALAHRDHQRRLHPEHPAIEAEVLHAARRELVRRIDDVLIRRIHLFHETADHGAAAVSRTAELLAQELGWDEARVREETERYLQQAAADGHRLVAAP